jgi:hypothetical protein
MQKCNVFGNTVTREIIFEPKIGESAFYGSFLLSGGMSPRRRFVAVVLFVLTRRCHIVQDRLVFITLQLY